MNEEEKTNDKEFGKNKFFVALSLGIFVAIVSALPFTGVIGANNENLFVITENHTETYMLQNNGSIQLFPNSPQVCDNETNVGSLYFNGSNFFRCEGNGWLDFATGDGIPNSTNLWTNVSGIAFYDGWVNATGYYGNGSLLTGISGGNSFSYSDHFDQNLNTTDNVIHNDINISNELNMNGLSPAIRSKFDLINIYSNLDMQNYDISNIDTFNAQYLITSGTARVGTIFSQGNIYSSSPSHNFWLGATTPTNSHFRVNSTELKYSGNITSNVTVNGLIKTDQGFCLPNEVSGELNVCIDAWDDINATGSGESLWTNSSGTINASGNDVQLAHVGINTEPVSNYWVKLVDNNFKNLAGFYIELQQNTTISAPLKFKNTIIHNDTGNPIGIIVDGEGSFGIDKNNEQAIYGSRMTLGEEIGASQTQGTRTAVGHKVTFENAVVSDGTFNQYGFQIEGSQNIAYSGGTPIVNSYGGIITGRDNSLLTGGTSNRVGLKITGYDASAYDNIALGLWIDDGDTLLDGKVNITDTSLVNNPHAEVYNITENGYTISIGSLNTWYNFTGLIAGEMSDISISSNGMQVSYAGRYKMDWSVSFSGVGGSTHAISATVNNTEHTPCRSYRKLGTAGDVGNMGGTCIMTLEANDIVRGVVMDINAPAQDIDIWSMNANIQRIANS